MRDNNVKILERKVGAPALTTQTMFDSILKGIGSFLGWIDSVTGNYLIALFIFAIIIEILMLPFGIKQQKNSIKQAKLRPKEMAIRKKYKGQNDQPTQQKIAQEIQELYQRENFNPMGGCLPLLLQIPVIMALYNIVINPLKYVVGMSDDVITKIVDYVKGTLELSVSNPKNTIELIAIIKSKGLEAFAGLEADALSALTEVVNKGLPNFDFLGLDLGLIPKVTEPSVLWLIPVITFVVYFGSMKLTRKLTYQPTQSENDKATGCSNAMMDITMPLFSVYLCFVIPGAVAVYWIFKSILNTLKQFILSRVMPYPVFTEEDYKAAEKEYHVKAKPEKKTTGAGSGKVRSLHHIDDEEDEAVPTHKAQPTPKKNKTEETAAEKPSASLIASAPLQEDLNRKPSEQIERASETADEAENTEDNK